ncbi:MAG: hypothetical protein M3083_00750 [Actinomycetota bacterium]|nr:hypothetical protein [Actinomycetota bacterium]MDQ6945911.1 hypothetical protein [Actinomycetota bacterium]
MVDGSRSQAGPLLDTVDRRMWAEEVCQTFELYLFANISEGVRDREAMRSGLAEWKAASQPSRSAYSDRAVAAARFCEALERHFADTASVPFFRTSDGVESVAGLWSEWAALADRPDTDPSA